MKKCLIVINTLSGRSSRIDETALVEKFGAAYSVYVKRILSPSDTWSAKGFSLVVACGGDGTFNRALNVCAEDGADLIYYGAGTFNECAKAKGKSKDKGEFIGLSEYACANGEYFGYVAAAGSFTPLGYVIPAEKKQRLGILAYLLRVIKEYRVYSIGAAVTADDAVYKGDYTLIMAIDSVRCFGFPFNKLYAPDDGKIHLLLIKSPGKDSLLNRIKIFFPLFRAFFIGFRRETESKNLVFKGVRNLDIKLNGKCVFDVDGDAVAVEGSLKVNVTKPRNKVYIGDFDTIRLHSQKRKERRASPHVGAPYFPHVTAPSVGSGGRMDSVPSLPSVQPEKNVRSAKFLP